MKKVLSFFCFVCLIFSAFAQETGTYQLPPKDIMDLVLADPAPTISVDGKAKMMLLMGRSSYPLVEELGQAEVKLAGLRLNPINFSPTRQNYIKSLKLKNIQSGKEININGLPAKMNVLNPTWNPSESKIAFFNVTNTGVDVYVIDIATANCRKINTSKANLVLGGSLMWMDDATVLYKSNVNIATNLKARPVTPKGPTIQENLGKVAPSVTYQDLIKSPYDEYVFEFLATTQLVKNTNGVEVKIGSPAIYSSVSLSPDKKYLLTRTIRKPFSYLVTAGGFASDVNVLSVDGKIKKLIKQLPSSEGTPSGYDNVQNTPRSFQWKDDEAATIIYAMPLDSGFIKKQVPFHDAIYAINAPFDGGDKELFKTTGRFSNVTWGNEDVALVTEVQRSKQRYTLSVYNQKQKALFALFERSLTDQYTNLGNPVTQKNKFGKEVLALVENGQSILMNNTTGSSPNDVI